MAVRDLRRTLLDVLDGVLADGAAGEGGDGGRWGALGDELLDGVPEWGVAERELGWRRDAAAEVLEGLCRGTEAVAWAAVLAALHRIRPVGSSPEFAGGHRSGRESCQRILLTHHPISAPPRADAAEFLAGLGRWVPELPAVDVVRERFRSVLDARAGGWAPDRRGEIAERAGRALAAAVRSARREARGELRVAHTRAASLAVALAAPGDLVVTDAVVRQRLAEQLTRYATAVALQVTSPGPFGTGFATACASGARLARERAADPRFAR